MIRAIRVAALVLGCASAAAGCATLQELGRAVSAPRFASAPDRDPELRLVAPGAQRPSGGAAVRLWLSVSNPNPFEITLSQLSATLSLEDAQAATADFPLGLPLRPREETVIPLDLVVDFSDVPAVGRALRQAVAGGAVGYELDGTVGVETPLGRPTFGPMRLVAGTLSLQRAIGAAGAAGSWEPR